MAGTSFSSQGSISGTPQAGLLGNLSNAFNTVKSGLGGFSPSGQTQGALTGNPTPPVSPTYGKVEGVLAPSNPTGIGTNAPQNTAGILAPNLGVKPSTPVKSITTPDGTQTTFHAPDTSTPAPAPIAPVNTTPPGTNGNNGTNFQQNLANVQTESNQGNSAAENQAYNQALQKSILLNAGAQNEQNAGHAGSSNTLNQASTDQLGTDYSNIFLPQTTANLQGEKGILNPELNQALTAESGIMSGILPEQQLATGGAENVAGLTAPQQYGPTGIPFSPGTGTVGPLAGTSATSGGNGTGSLANIGALQTTQDQGAQVQNMKGIQTQAQALGTNLTNLISQSGFNSTNGGIATSAINGIKQWVNNQSGDPQYKVASDLIQEIASKYSSLLNSSGGTPTDVSNTTQSIINGLASGQSIEQVISSLDKNATDSISALSSAANGNSQSQNTSSNSSIYNF
jgi:hypothetical protein